MRLAASKVTVSPLRRVRSPWRHGSMAVLHLAEISDRHWVQGQAPTLMPPYTPTQKVRTVGIVHNNVLPVVTPRRDVIQRSRKFQSQWSCHGNEN
jgi:hypothetical protein